MNLLAAEGPGEPQVGSQAFPKSCYCSSIYSIAICKLKKLIRDTCKQSRMEAAKAATWICFWHIWVWAWVYRLCFFPGMILSLGVRWKARNFGTWLTMVRKGQRANPSETRANGWWVGHNLIGGWVSWWQISWWSFHGTLRKSVWCMTVGTPLVKQHLQPYVCSILRHIDVGRKIHQHINEETGRCNPSNTNCWGCPLSTDRWCNVAHIVYLRARAPFRHGTVSIYFSLAWFWLLASLWYTDLLIIIIIIVIIIIIYYHIFFNIYYIFSAFLHIHAYNIAQATN